MDDNTGARPANVTIDDLTDDERAALTPAQREKLSSGAGDLPVSHLSPHYNEPASAEFVDPRDPRVAAGEVEPTDTAEADVEAAPAGKPEAFEGNGDGMSPHVLPDADPDGDDTGPMPAILDDGDGESA